MRLTVLALTLAVASVSQSMTDLQVAEPRPIEGNNGPHTVDVLVALSQPATAPTVVTFATRDATATASADYVAAMGTLTFAKGESVKRITVTVIGETLIETDEVFDVVLSDT